MDQSPDLVWHNAMKCLCSPLPLSKGTWIYTKSKHCHKHTKITCGDEKVGVSCKWDEPAIAAGLPAKPDPAERQPGQNTSEMRHGMWSRQAKITPLTPFFKHAGVNLSPPRWLSRSSPPRSAEPRGNSHAKKAMRDADLFGTSDKFSCPEQSCGILRKSMFWAYYNTLV